MFTKFSLVNPMPQITTNAEFRLNPALRRAPVSQKVVPVRQMVLASEECTTALPPTSAKQGTVQKSYTAMRATRAQTKPASAGVARITTQNSPGATDTELTADTVSLETIRETAGAKTSHEPADSTQHEPPQETRKRTRTVQSLDLGTLQTRNNPIASPHKLAQGKRRKLMNPSPWMRFHPFVETLEKWALGVAAACGSPWTETAINAAVARGPHTSALTPEARDLIEEEMHYQIRAGFSEIVLWSDIRTRLPQHLKVSPIAVIPQVGRRGRLLLDLSFPRFRQHGPQASGVDAIGLRPLR